MPFLKQNSPYYRVRIKIPGYGYTGTLSTKTTKKRRAREMERLLREIGERGWFEVLDALRDRSEPLNLPTVLRAKHDGQLRQLRKNLSNPTIGEAVEEYRPYEDYRRAENGLDQLLCLAPTHKRISWLDGQTITKLCRRMIAGDYKPCDSLQNGGYKPNSVRNSLFLGIRKMLRFHLGNAETERIFTNVNVPNEDDARMNWLTADQIRDVLDACDPKFRRYVGTLITTGIDKSPALRLRVRDVNLEERELFVDDTKTNSRRRTISISRAATRFLRLACAGKSGDDRLFEYTSDMVRHRWEPAREEAGVPDCRIKDLRHTFAVHFLKGGGDLAQLSQLMGHKNRSTTLRYAMYESTAHTEDVDQMDVSMGLDGGDLRQAC